jgi:spore coat polysaccharide biosynthesis protein SpsF
VKVVAIIQARMGSTRLPGKVLRTLGTKSVLAHVICRVRSADKVDETIVATTDNSSDDAIEEEAGRWGAGVFRGSEEDVLSRYHGAAAVAKADLIVRVTSDCPLIDPEVIDEMVARFEALVKSDDRPDYLSNTVRRTYPRGLDVEIITFSALDKAFREANKPSEREHVTPYIWGHPDKFRLEGYASSDDFSRFRWTLDTAEDWSLLTRIFQQLDSGAAFFPTSNVIALFESQPELVKLNESVVQKSIGH